MAAQAQYPKPSLCAEKQRLSDALLSAVREIVALHGEEVADIVRGGSGFPRFNVALTLARVRRDNAKNAYLLHIQAHGC